MPVFARKPAPIQATYLGYLNTTGLAAMDYRIGDAFSDSPDDSTTVYCENIVRLPDVFLCYEAPQGSPPVAETPSAASRRVTFGCFNVLAKITPEVVEVWSRIIASVPNSRIFLKADHMDDPAAHRRLINLFEGHDIGAERIVFLPRATSVLEHLEMYGEVDIALDSFPYNGTTTTFEALWMGVPTIVLSGKTHGGRVGVSIMSNAGLPGLIASTPESYRDLAVEMARDGDHLRMLRRQLRSKLKDSLLMDRRGFPHSLERAYRHIWLRWVRGAKPSALRILPLP